MIICFIDIYIISLIFCCGFPWMNFSLLYCNVILVYAFWHTQKLIVKWIKKLLGKLCFLGSSGRKMAGRKLVGIRNLVLHSLINTGKFYEWLAEMLVRWIYEKKSKIIRDYDTLPAGCIYTECISTAPVHCLFKHQV